MSDKFRICFAVAAGFIVAVDLALCAGLAVIKNGWTAFGIGTALLVAAGFSALVFHVSRKGWQTALIMLCSAVGCGLGVTACLRGLGAGTALSGALGLRLLGCTGISLGLFLVYGLIADRMERGLKLFTFLLVGLSWTAGILLWALVRSDIFFCLLFFHLFLVLLFCFPLIICAESLTTLRKNLVLSSLTIAFLVLLIALVILTEGEALDGGELIDGFSVESPGKSKLNRRKPLPPG